MKNTIYPCSISTLRVVFAFAFCVAGLLCTMPGLAATGEWQIVTSPNVDTLHHNEFNGIACVSESDCWAVGDYYTDAKAYQTLIEHWDGTSWVIVPSANTDATQTNLLVNVTCVSSADCWAVGKYKNIISAGGGSLVIVDQTLIEHWDGSAWSIVTSANTVPVENNVLRDVTCVSASDCWAAGSAFDPVSGVDQILAEHWNGTLWAIVTTPTTGEPDYLTSIKCTSSSDCWTVGSAIDLATSKTKSLVAHWDGNTWALVDLTNAAPLPSGLSSVACNAPNDCWADGSHDPGPGFGEATLIVHWGGTTWNAVPSPNTDPKRNNFLFGVACANANDCWATGVAYNGIAEQTLMQHWDGGAWSIMPSPNTSDRKYNHLWSIACPSPTRCFAVGYYYMNADNLHQALALHYVPPVQLSAVASRMVHGSAGTFDVNLPLTGSSGIECRSSGASGDYTVVFTFTNPLTNIGSASVSSGTGSVTASSIDSNEAHNYIVNLTGVANAQVIIVGLSEVTDAAGDFSSVVSAQMGVLLGDVNASRRVDAADVSLVRQQTLQPIISSNFREDINASGRIDAADVSIARQQTLTSLP